ncbi:MAG: NAD+ synthase [Candidatus Krumholzibacteriia bacterium]
MRITVAQINPVVGAINDNVSRLLSLVETAAGERADLVVFPELVVTGYPPRDLLERPTFVAQARAGLDVVVDASKAHPELGIILGCPLATGQPHGKPLYNAALLIGGGKVLCEQPKMLLPTYDVFDEARHFMPAGDNGVVEFGGAVIGLSICEDLWCEPDPWNRRPYATDPIEMLAQKGATLLINISASPFSMGKEKTRYELMRNHAMKHGIPFLLVNQVGGNDDLVFDGRSLLVGADGSAVEVLPSFEESVRTIDTDAGGREGPYAHEDDVTAVLKALVLGTRDYVAKCGFEKALIGLSGGIDSAVTAAVACRALGPENVLGVAMPSPHSSKGSLDDARALADNLGIRLELIAIDDVMKVYDRALREVFAGRESDKTEENIQARIRGNIIMAISNKFGYLPLSTGNKSELAVGYCTLYGDMSGGLAVISDVPKTLVYRLAHHINAGKPVIPASTIEKAPSAELKPGQKDADTLPPYEVLDRILERLIDGHLGIDRIVEDGFDRDTVAWVALAVRRNEYKRKQAPPGIKVTSKAFGAGRRVPIAARYDA